MNIFLSKKDSHFSALNYCAVNIIVSFWHHLQAIFLFIEFYVWKIIVLILVGNATCYTHFGINLESSPVSLPPALCIYLSACLTFKGMGCGQWTLVFSDKGHIACRVCFWVAVTGFSILSDVHSELPCTCIAAALQLQSGHFLHILLFILDFFTSSLMLARSVCVVLLPRPVSGVYCWCY